MCDSTKHNGLITVITPPPLECVCVNVKQLWKHTPLYKNEQNERPIVQLRLLLWIAEWFGIPVANYWNTPGSHLNNGQLVVCNQMSGIQILS